MKKFSAFLVLLALGSFVFSHATPSHAYTIGFYRITNNGNPDISSQLSVSVEGVTENKVSFTFYNNVGTVSSITDIYFDDGTLLGISTIESSLGVSFSAPATPKDLPGANLISPPFVTSTAANEYFSADSDSQGGVVNNGVNSSSEWVRIVFSLVNGKSFGDTTAALASGALRIGLHVQGIGATMVTTGGSDSYVNTPVPVPAAAWLLASGLIGLAVVRRRIRE